MEKLSYPWIAGLLDRLPGEPKALPRALLITGRPGLGKRDLALFLVAGLLCEAQRQGIDSCGNCASCLLLTAGNHPDLRLLEVGQQDEEGPDAAVGEEEAAAAAKKPTRQISVDRVRSLHEFVSITSHRGGSKVVCIIPAEAMHPSAANAVLKILEEPPGDTFFILVSHRPDRLLPTIRSRCFHLAVPPPEIEPAMAWLRKQGTSNPELSLAQGGYAPLAAQEFAKDETFWGLRKALLDTLASKAFDPLRAAEQAEEIDPGVVSVLLSRWAYDIVSLQSGGGVRYHLDYIPALKQLAGAIDAAQLLAWYDTTVQFGRVAQHPLNKRLAMESLLAGYPGR